MTAPTGSSVTFRNSDSVEASAVDLPATDFVAIAGGFGVPAKEVTTDDLESGLGWALDQPGPAVVVTQAELDPPPGI